ncbi:uncharacterized protein VTP21DRAFT_7265 [Calcarisporiella thermophila]|uniref:uncharacterized protein n=1 Tax=Calcarisporiella thermophila TaxID=911321 RepID=UPI0037420FF4
MKIKGSTEESMAPPTAPPIKRVLFFVHGMGQQYEKLGNLPHHVETLQQNIDDMLRTLYPHPDNFVKVIPIEWHSGLHKLVDHKIEKSTLKTVPKVRLLANEWISDVIYYFTNEYGQVMVDIICKQLNEKYAEFLAENPDFETSGGEASVICFSLGGILMYDILAHQVQDVQTGGKYPHRVPKLDFKIKHLFTCGSPVAAVIVMRSQEMKEYPLPDYCRLHNIFHPYDPLGYRTEPLIDDLYTQVPPVVIERTKRKRILPKGVLPSLGLPSLTTLGSTSLLVKAKGLFYRKSVSQQEGFFLEEMGEYRYSADRRAQKHMQLRRQKSADSLLLVQNGLSAHHNDVISGSGDAEPTPEDIQHLSVNVKLDITETRRQSGLYLRRSQSVVSLEMVEEGGDEADSGLMIPGASKKEQQPLPGVSPLQIVPNGNMSSPSLPPEHDSEDTWSPEDSSYASDTVKRHAQKEELSIRKKLMKFAMSSRGLSNPFQSRPESPPTSSASSYSSSDGARDRTERQSRLMDVAGSVAKAALSTLSVVGGFGVEPAAFEKHSHASQYENEKMAKAWQGKGEEEEVEREEVEREGVVIDKEKTKVDGKTGEKKKEERGKKEKKEERKEMHEGESPQNKSDSASNAESTSDTSPGRSDSPKLDDPGTVRPRMDYVLTETLLDNYANEWIVAIKSHFRYWANRDVVLHVLRTWCCDGKHGNGEMERGQGPAHETLGVGNGKGEEHLNEIDSDEYSSDNESVEFFSPQEFFTPIDNAEIEKVLDEFSLGERA